MPSACTTPHPQASNHMPSGVEAPVERGLDEEPERVAAAPEDMQSIRELLGHPRQLLGKRASTPCRSRQGSPGGPTTARSKRRRWSRTPTQNRPSIAYPLIRTCSTETGMPTTRSGSGWTVGTKTSASGQDDAQVQAVDDPLGHDRARGGGHRDGPLARLRARSGRRADQVGPDELADAEGHEEDGGEADARHREEPLLRHLGHAAQEEPPPHAPEPGERERASPRSGQRPPLDVRRSRPPRGRSSAHPCGAVNQMPNVMTRDATSLPLWRFRKLHVKPLRRSV